jgi:pyrimidine-nucleoside phosphorylase
MTLRIKFMDIRSVISRRRDGAMQTREEFDFIARGAADGSIPDYQLAAWLMAMVLRPATDTETAELTLAMAESGAKLDLTGVPRPWVDKHSTGGVGDKTTLVLAPLMAACGISVIKMSGRGLGITGGTLDKLMAIPGFRTDLTPDELVAQAKKIGIALAGQTGDLAPADKALYALRDVTETVSSLPLIVSSILSKKIAGGADTVILDVKCGSGSFNKDQAVAELLADALTRVGKHAGLKVFAAITDMDQPLGATIGNSLEVREALDVLSKPIDELSGPTKRLRELCRYFAAVALRVSGLAITTNDALVRIDDVISSGRALAKAQEWSDAQGGTVSLNDRDWLVKAPEVQVVSALSSGFVHRVDARLLGELAMDLGAGRKSKEDEIDLAVGLEIHVKVGDAIEAGAPLVTVHSSTPAEYTQRIQAAVVIGRETVAPRPILIRPI